MNFVGRFIAGSFPLSRLFQGMALGSQQVKSVGENRPTVNLISALLHWWN